ncbi:hypothetical protein Tco_0715194 [Tanacetum coccineum]
MTEKEMKLLKPLSLTLHKTSKIAEEQENKAKVQEKILEKDVEKIIEEDFGTRIQPGSHKENPETVDNNDEEEKKYDKKDDYNDDDDNDDHDDYTA